jgi:hypothetical protein
VAPHREAGLVLDRRDDGIDVAAVELDYPATLLADDVVAVRLLAVVMATAIRAQRRAGERVAVAPLLQMELTNQPELLQYLERPVHCHKAERRMPGAARFE